MNRQQKAEGESLTGRKKEEENKRKTEEKQEKGRLELVGPTRNFGIFSDFSKFILMLVFFPVILIGMLVIGLVKLAFPLLIIFGVVAMFGMDR